MGRYSSCPVPNTCPKIDEVLSRLDSAIEELTTCKGLMEKLREANESLRKWGTEMEGERDDFEDLCAEKDKELANKDKTIDELLASISDWSSKVDSLEAQIQQLDDDRSYL